MADKRTSRFTEEQIISFIKQAETEMSTKEQYWESLSQRPNQIENLSLTSAFKLL